MAKQNVTIALDRAKARLARLLLGRGSTSDVIDIALDRLIREEQLKNPPTELERAIMAAMAAKDLRDAQDEVRHPADTQ